MASTCPRSSWNTWKKQAFDRVRAEGKTSWPGRREVVGACPAPSSTAIRVTAVSRMVERRQATLKILISGSAPESQSPSGLHIIVGAKEESRIVSCSRETDRSNSTVGG